MPEEWNLSIARKMRAGGMPFKQIGAHFGVASSTVMARLDPAYAEARRKADRSYDRERNRTQADDCADAVRVKPVREHVRPAIDDAEAFRQLAALPKYETRSLTGIIMGDPPAHRSALAMRNASAG